MASVVASSNAGSTAVRSCYIPPPPPPPPPQNVHKHTAKIDLKRKLSRADDKKTVNPLTSEYPKFKTSMCFFFKKSRCANGKDCKFAHGFPELKKSNQQISHYNRRTMTEPSLTSVVFLPPPPTSKLSSSDEFLNKSRLEQVETQHLNCDHSTEGWKLQECRDESPSRNSGHVSAKTSPVPTVLSESSALLQSPSLTLPTCSFAYTDFYDSECSLTPRSYVSPFCGEDQEGEQGTVTLSPPSTQFSEDAYHTSAARTSWSDYESPCLHQSVQMPTLNSDTSSSVPKQRSRIQTRQRVLALISQMVEVTAPFRTGYYPHMASSMVPRAERKAMEFSYLAALACLNPLTTSNELEMTVKNVGCLGDNYD